MFKLAAESGAGLASLAGWQSLCQCFSTNQLQRSLYNRPQLYVQNAPKRDSLNNNSLKEYVGLRDLDELSWRIIG